MAAANRDLIDAGYAALNRGDIGAVLALIDEEDFSWEEGDRSLGGSEHQDRDSFAQFCRSWIDAFEGFHIDLIEVLEFGDEYVVIGRQSGRGRASALPVEAEVVHVWTVRNGRATRWRPFPNRAEALVAVA